jgi:hypothetical protein
MAACEPTGGGGKGFDVLQLYKPPWHVAGIASSSLPSDTLYARHSLQTKSFDHIKRRVELRPYHKGRTYGSAQYILSIDYFFVAFRLDFLSKKVSKAIPVSGLGGL